MTEQAFGNSEQFKLYKMYKMTTKTLSDIITKKTRSEIGREVSAYIAPNYHLCQNYCNHPEIPGSSKPASIKTWNVTDTAQSDL